MIDGFSRQGRAFDGKPAAIL
ncbi:hypothetical protein TRIP_C90121 [Candidatus Zixiibacteriota bacterium]|nr:hypothetical protein TRIP_C90121 [candidate division Zixibacteria bacterium]